ncbi:tRNA 5-methylaminomethyl-2-thiouridine biosynthesis bifunctional protein MnmC [Anaplasma phagocytophilum]|uniref:FAD-dependent oxidoreductase n=1 Tax=Anaplasma phagocytophilum TaxID=948 RepID=UPI0007E09582|nr:FAD-dependent oxidoreductase [Anaplasma phagocytophilum]SCV62541.1 tRNA 5-methylaminomethyl-2-thiouridine biosynthesis bifunctional protein MnmC [Anaplasma phagocytophilum]SCV66865.1 tRNA 5-methylaminomethyl-2-thiouridine biosynthesis bifunctional protein MnmC [Anaplasma phagocytophilum]
MVKTAGIAGAGLVGRILALALLRDGWRVTIFDRDDTIGKASCGYIAAGMLSLYSEAENTGDLVIDLGYRSMELWPQILSDIGAEFCLQALGSVMVAHAADLSDLEMKCAIIRNRFPDVFSELRITNKVYELEEGISAPYGMYIKGEGSIDSINLFKCLERALRDYGITWYSNVNVLKVQCAEIVTEQGLHTFDFVFDCRGVGAKSEVAGLRGVRGEAILVKAPGVTIKRAVRMMHPRYSVYVVPRQENMFIVGASEIESCDYSEVSVQSALEMLSAIYSLHRGFAEARILDMMSACRPAFRDNVPRVLVEDRAIRINGLYRYGYLCVPAIVEEVLSLLNGGTLNHQALFSKN